MSVVEEPIWLTQDALRQLQEELDAIVRDSADDDQAQARAIGRASCRERVLTDV